MKYLHLIILLFFFFFIISCKKKQYINISKSPIGKTVENKKDTLRKIKDTTLFVNSSEGEEVTFYINNLTNDSIIISEVMGETGKSDYKFIFNKNLKSAECKIYRYAEPIYVNSNPKIISQKTEKLNTSKESNKRLSALFQSYRNILINNNSQITNKIDDNWFGKYKLIINDNDDDWRDINEVELDISKNSVTYIAKGYQLYQNFKLAVIEKNNVLYFTFEKANDNTSSWALEKTKDFGVLKLNGEKYIWNSPYIDINFSNGKQSIYELKK